jgi:chromosome segregation ATPase
MTKPNEIAELVERLREEAAEIKCEHDADADLLLEAASALERLSAERDALKTANDELHDRVVEEDGYRKHYRTERDMMRDMMEKTFDASASELAKAQARIAELEKAMREMTNAWMTARGALREIADYAEREYREGEKGFQFSIIARAALKEED